MSAALTFLMLLTFFIPSSAAFKNGDVVNYYLYTDIVTYINKIPIRSYNIDGYTAVVVEDLANYGFDVVWSAGARTLSVTRNTSKQVVGGYEPGANTGKVGSRAGEVYFTDIVTYFNGNAVKSYNVGGRTIAYVDDLADYYKETYVWDSYARTLSLTLRGASPSPSPSPSPQPSSPLAITAQPKNSVAKKGDAASFEVTVKGGVAPYSYQWQIRQGTTGSWNNITYLSSKMSIFVSDADLNNPNYYRCVITDSAGTKVTSDAAYVSTTQPGALKASLAYESISVYSTETFTLSVNVSGGKAPYTYQWYHGDSAGNYTAIAANTKTISFKPDPAPATQYLKCSVIDSDGAIAESAPCKITLKDSPVNLVATLDKTSVSVGVNESFTLNCSVTGGTAPYKYKWYFGDQNGKFTDMTTYYTPVSAVTGSSITARPDPNHPTHYLKCEVTDYTGKIVFSNTCAIVLTKTLKAQLYYAELVVYDNDTFSIPCTVEGGIAPYYYTWEILTSDGSTYANASGTGFYGTNTSTLSGAGWGTSTTCYFRCRVRDSQFNEVITKSCKVIFMENPTGLKAKLDKTDIYVRPNSSINIFCTPSGGSGNYTYQWYFRYEGGSFQEIMNNSTATNSTVMTSPYQPENYSVWYYICKVTDSVTGKSVYSDVCKATLRTW